MKVFAADIGGTTSRFAIISLIPSLKIVLKETIESKPSTKLFAAVTSFLEKAATKGHKVTKGSFSVAGPPSEKQGRRCVAMNNGPFTVAEVDLEKKTRLKTAKVVNDFEAIGYVIGRLPKKSVTVLRKGSLVKDASVALIGPGTGLGQALVVPVGKRQQVLLSEGHHADIPLITAEEFALGAFTNHEEKRPKNAPVWHEDLLSGRGLERLYRFLRHTRFRNKSDLPAHLSAGEVSETRKSNPCSKAAMDFFAILLARRCRNYVLETGARAGLYLAGGVVQKNADAFGQDFVKEFSSHQHPQWKALLDKIPIAIIKDPDAGLLGAGLALRQ